VKTSPSDPKFTTHGIRYYSLSCTTHSLSYPLLPGSPLSLSPTFHHGSSLSLTGGTWRRAARRALGSTVAPRLSKARRICMVVANPALSLNWRRRWRDPSSLLGWLQWGQGLPLPMPWWLGPNLPLLVQWWHGPTPSLSKSESTTWQQRSTHVVWPALGVVESCGPQAHMLPS
jgi:hypothetical protein